MHFKNRILVTTKHTKSSWQIIFLSEYNCVTQFDTRCTDWDKVTVKFVALTVFPSFPLSLMEKNLKILDWWVFVLDHRVFVLDHKVFVLDHRVSALDHRVLSLRKWQMSFSCSILGGCHRKFHPMWTKVKGGGGGRSAKKDLMNPPLSVYSHLGEHGHEIWV